MNKTSIKRISFYLFLLSLLGGVFIKDYSQYFFLLMEFFLMIFILARVRNGYKNESQIWTRGGLIYKEKNPQGYKFAYGTLYFSVVLCFLVLAIFTIP